MKGTAWTFGDEINTDLIAPSQYYGDSEEETAKHILEPIRPEFASAIEEGDIIVAGKHFGSGSSREIAPKAIKRAGIGGIVAESFSRTFYRNAFAIGLPVVASEAASENIVEGDQIEIELRRGIVRNLTQETEYSVSSLPDVLVSLLDQGGLVNYYQNNEGFTE